MTGKEGSNLVKRPASSLSFKLDTPSSKRSLTSRKKVTAFDDEDDEDDRKETILSFSDNKIVSANPKIKEKPLVIPLPKDINIGKIGIRKNQDHLMLAKIAKGEDVDMEVDDGDTVEDNFEGEIIKCSSDDIDPNLPLLLRNRRLELEEIKNEDERFREDVSCRPDSASLDDYRKTPIQNFGEAMLRGMDWKPGMQVGMNGRGLIKPIELKPRPKGLGLGAHPSQFKKKRKEKDEEAAKFNTWMRRGIVVRVISKSFEKGELFRKRVRILNVDDERTCTVTVDGRIVENVKKRDIETALPKVGGRVMVLKGSNTGRIAILKNRDSKRCEATVKFEDDSSTRVYYYEEIAEYAL